MRKLKLQVQVSIDGFVAGPNGEMNWLTFDWSEDIKDYVTRLTDPVDTILLGRKLAEGFIPHWKNVADDPSNPEREAGIKFTSTAKVVFSRKGIAGGWENTEVETGDFVKKINALKNQQGGDMIAYGGAEFVSSLIRENLFDELHLFINPAVIGKGLSIFSGVTEITKYNLAKVEKFDCGVSIAVYKPA